MEGMYSSNLAQQQRHQQQQHQQQQQNSMQNQNINPADQMNMMQGDQPADIDRRQSMPHTFHNQMMADMEQDASRRMSTMAAPDMASFNAQNPNQFMFQTMAPQFPTINTANLNMPGQLDSYMGNASPYSAMQNENMGSMMSPQFANMDMSAMFDPNDNTAAMAAAQFPHQQMGQMSPAYGMQANSINNTNSINTAPQQAPVQQLPTPTTTTAATNTTTTDVSTNGDNGVDTNQNGSASNNTPTAPPMGASNSQDNDMSGYNKTVQSMSSHASSSGSVVSGSQDQSSTALTQPSGGSSGATPTTNTGPQEVKKKSIYSKSGFDMIKALWLVATRKNPQIHLGAVDMSCAFVVCDVTMNDCPIVYVSDNFQNLTGYSRHDIVGQNCRFLQAPDGKVEAGTKREFVDNGAVLNLKKMVEERKEVQQSLINYRKGGKPFLNLLTMIPIPWDTDEIRYFIGFQIDLVECPDAISAGEEFGGVAINYKHSDIGQYIWAPPTSGYWDADNGQTLGVDDVSTLLQQFNPKGIVSDWHKQSWDKMLLENSDDVIHVLSLKGLFLYLSPACKRILEYDGADLVGNSLSTICHPSDIVPVTRELKEATVGSQVNIVFRIRRKQSGYTWFESHGSLYAEAGKGRKCIILVGRKRPVFALSRRSLEENGGIGDSEIWTKISTSGMFLFVSSNVRSLLDLLPDNLIGTSIQDLMRKESRPEFGRAMEKARRGKIVSAKHEVQNRRGQGLQAQTTLYPGDASAGQKPSFLLAQTKLLKASSRSSVSVKAANSVSGSNAGDDSAQQGVMSQAGGQALAPGNQDAALASDDNIFDELRTTKCSSWQFELRQMEKINRILAEELGGLLSNKKKRKRRKGVGNVVRDCVNCHTKNTPEWRRGPSGNRDLCNSCGLRYAKQVCAPLLLLKWPIYANHGVRWAVYRRELLATGIQSATARSQHLPSTRRHYTENYLRAKHQIPTTATPRALPS